MNPMASKRKIEILCPKCGWRPSEDSIWCHDPGCGHIWNAFDTGGICPNCGGGGTTTQCPACGACSPHSAWYRETIDGREVGARRVVQ